MKKILVYRDEGVGKECVRVLKRSLERLIAGYSATQAVHLCDVSAEEIISDSCFHEAKLLIIPGGRDLPYVKKLNGKGNQNITKFVKNGGNFLGIGAGAYFASASCNFEEGTELEVCGPRELGFFPGIAKGAVYPGFQYDSVASSRVVNINIKHILERENAGGHDAAPKKTYPVYFDGGCEFVMNSESIKKCNCLAVYEDFPDKVAIVSCQYGEGTAILSGVHPEKHPDFLDRSKYTEEQWTHMTNSAEAQQELWISIVNMFNLL